MRPAARRARRRRRGRRPSATEVEALIAFVVDDPRYPGSIAHSLEAAWANARGAREAISSEMWESINTTHATLAARRGGSAFARHNLLGWVRDRAAIVAGLADATHEPRRRLALHRARPHPRTGRHDRAPAVDPARRRVGNRGLGRDAAVAARRTRRTSARTGAASSGAARVEFLLLDRLFPRSVFHALSAAESVLFDLDPGPARRGTGSEAAPARRPRVRGARVRARRRARSVAARSSSAGSSAPAPTRTTRSPSASSTRRPRSGGAPDDLAAVGRARDRRTRTTGDVLASYNEARLTPRTRPPARARPSRAASTRASR